MIPIKMDAITTFCKTSCAHGGLPSLGYDNCFDCIADTQAAQKSHNKPIVMNKVSIELC